MKRNISLSILFVLVFYNLPLIGETTNYQLQLNQDFQLESIEPDYWPTASWRNSTPEEQGMDSDYLQRMNQTIYDESLWFDSVIVVKNGYIVYEDYPSGNFDADSHHLLHSATKSITSGLVGIALTQGYIDDVYYKVLDYFPNKTFQNMSPEKENLTLEHILTMTPGLEWDEWSLPYTDPANDLITSIITGDTVQYVLNKPVIHTPGTHWTYNTGCSNLLIKIIEKATGMDGLDFAIQNLFDPLGISSSLWRADGQGSIFGGHELWMKPRDAAKFGYLYLNNGTWDGEQIISPEYVAASGETHIDISQWHPYWIETGYGYQWWTDSYREHYYANGQDGQMIYVIHEYDLVVFFNGYSEAGPYNSIDGPGPRMVNNYIIPAIRNFESTATETEPTSPIDEDDSLLIPITFVSAGSLIAIIVFMSRKITRNITPSNPSG